MLYYGACYYPEHWNAQQAKDHLTLMKKAGINVVRMGEFAWCKWEPEEGEYDFSWLDQVITSMNFQGINVVLGTPTCIPPPWFFAKKPDVLIRDREGRKLNPLARCHCCKNAPEYLEACDRIVELLAKHYADVDGVIGWQTDNEFGCHHTTRCYCSHCQVAFRKWLSEQYGSVEELNEAWGTSFWSFDFHDWKEIPLPRYAPTGVNPGHWLDFLRFSSNTQVRFHRRQMKIIRKYCPDHFITHNFMGRFPEIDYYKLSKYVDFPSWDNYPDAHDDPLSISYAHAITRSTKGSFWVMEQKSGPTGDAATGLLGEQPEPGEIRRWAWQSVANGADGVNYFRWRACLTGAEQYWHGILDHDGIPRRRYAEVMQTGQEFEKAAQYLENTHVVSKVALIRSFDNLWSLENQPGASGFHYDDHCFSFYRAVRRTGNNCDVINTDANLSKYKVVLAPCLALLHDTILTSLDSFVSDGGTLVLTPQSGSRTWANAMAIGTRPGKLVELVSATVEEVRPYHRGQKEAVNFARGALIAEQCQVGSWVEVLQCISAETVAEYMTGNLGGKPAIVRNAHGKGQVYYMGVYLPQDVLERFLAGILPEFFIKTIPEGVEVTIRRGEQGRFVFVINHNAESQRLEVPGTVTELLTGETVGPKLKVSGNGVLLLKG